MEDLLKSTFTEFSGSEIIAWFKEDPLFKIRGLHIQRREDKYEMGSSKPRCFRTYKACWGGELIPSEDFCTSPYFDDMARQQHEAAKKYLKTDLPYTPYPIQIPPIDITLNIIGEYGSVLNKKIYTAEIMYEDGSYPTELKEDQKYQFVARDFDYV